jgi:hypothetical protein
MRLKRRAKILGAFGGALALLGMTTAAATAASASPNSAGPPTLTHGVQPTYTRGNITKCPRGTTTFINTSEKNDGHHDRDWNDPKVGDARVGTTFETTVSSDGVFLSFITNSPSFTIYMKGGPAYNTYDYTGTRTHPAFPMDSGLHPPFNGGGRLPQIGHYLACGQPAAGMASPTVVTSPSIGGSVGAVVLNDTGILSGGASPTGTITFNLYDPAHSDCSGIPAFTQTLSVSGNGSYTTTNTTPADVSGIWSWTAVYSGDNNNNPASSACSNETVSVAKAAPELTTTPGAGGSVDQAVLNDTAMLSGGVSPTGTITFNLYDPAHSDCSGTPAFTQTLSVSGNGSYTTTNSTPASSSGTWNWTATYSGDDNNNPASTPCGEETASVSEVPPPSLTTTPSAGGAVGEVVLNDTGMLSGGVSPTGTITFNLYDPAHSDCSGTPAFTQTLTVTGDGSYTTTNSTPADASGTWSWTATYSGDQNNSGDTTPCGDETVSVAKAAPTLTTTPSGQGTVGEVVLNDTGMLSGGVSPTGTITFNLFDPAHSDCSGIPAFTQTLAVTGNGSYSTTNSKPASLAGTWSWTANYNGDSNNNGASSRCSQEMVAVTKATPSLTTQPSPGGSVGTVVLNDTGVLSGGASPGGTVTFNLYDPAHRDCSGTPAFTQTVTALGNGSYSTTNSTPASAPGTWSWTASYSGDPNNNGAASACTLETVSIAKAEPSLTTTPSPGGVAATVVLNDTGTISGGFQPTGSIIFNLFDPAHADCSGTPAFTQTLTVSGNGSYSTTNSTPAGLAGTWSWTGAYSGDSNNNSASSGCSQEMVTVAKATPSLTTRPSPGGSVGMVVLNDSGVLSGGASPGGTITFDLFDPAHSDCSGAPAFTQTVTASGNGSYSTTNSTAASVLGTWDWTASYSGDNNNTGASTACSDETVAVTKAPPSLTTTPSAGGTVGTVVLNDTGIISAGFRPTGSIIFSLFDPAHVDCSGTPAFTQTLTVSGNGSYSTTNSTPAGLAGTWSWTAIYSGDSNNNGASSGCSQETVAVAKATPSLTTRPSPSGAVGVIVLNDSATVSGGFHPRGTITFNLFDPAHTDCSGTPAFTQTLTVSGNGTYSTTNSDPAGVTGTWNWSTTYSGDDNNASASSPCTQEMVTVTGALG